MSLPQFVAPVLSIAGPAALVLVILRCFPSVSRAVVTLVAGLAAVLSNDEKRREAGIRVLDVLTRRDETPPRDKAAERPEIGQAPALRRSRLQRRNDPR